MDKNMFLARLKEFYLQASHKQTGLSNEEINEITTTLNNLYGERLHLLFHNKEPDNKSVDNEKFEPRVEEVVVALSHLMYSLVISRVDDSGRRGHASELLKRHCDLVLDLIPVIVHHLSRVNNKAEVLVENLFKAFKYKNPLFEQTFFEYKDFVVIEDEFSVVYMAGFASLSRLLANCIITFSNCKGFLEIEEGLQKAIISLNEDSELSSVAYVQYAISTLNLVSEISIYMTEATFIEQSRRISKCCLDILLRSSSEAIKGVPFHEIKDFRRLFFFNSECKLLPNKRKFPPYPLDQQTTIILRIADKLYFNQSLNHRIVGVSLFSEICKTNKCVATLIDFFIDAGKLSQIISSLSHIELVKRSANLIGFASSNGLFSNEDLSSIWQATISHRSFFVLFSDILLTNLVPNVALERLQYFCSVMQSTPLSDQILDFYAQFALKCKQRNDCNELLGLQRLIDAVGDNGELLPSHDTDLAAKQEMQPTPTDSLPKCVLKTINSIITSCFQRFSKAEMDSTILILVKSLTTGSSLYASIDILGSLYVFCAKQKIEFALNSDDLVKTIVSVLRMTFLKKSFPQSPFSRYDILERAFSLLQNAPDFSDDELCMFWETAFHYLEQDGHLIFPFLTSLIPTSKILPSLLRQIDPSQVSFAQFCLEQKLAFHDRQTSTSQLLESVRRLTLIYFETTNTEVCDESCQFVAQAMNELSGCGEISEIRRECLLLIVNRISDPRAIHLLWLILSQETHQFLCPNTSLNLIFSIRFEDSKVCNELCVECFTSSKLLTLESLECIGQFHRFVFDEKQKSLFINPLPTIPLASSFVSLLLDSYIDIFLHLFKCVDKFEHNTQNEALLILMSLPFKTLKELLKLIPKENSDVCVFSFFESISFEFDFFAGVFSDHDLASFIDQFITFSIPTSDSMAPFDFLRFKTLIFHSHVLSLLVLKEMYHPSQLTVSLNDCFIKHSSKIISKLFCILSYALRNSNQLNQLDILLAIQICTDLISVLPKCMEPETSDLRFVIHWFPFVNSTHVQNQMLLLLCSVCGLHHKNSNTNYESIQTYVFSLLIENLESYIDMCLEKFISLSTWSKLFALLLESCDKSSMTNVLSVFTTALKKCPREDLKPELKSIWECLFDSICLLVDYQQNNDEKEFELLHFLMKKALFSSNESSNSIIPMCTSSEVRERAFKLTLKVAQRIDNSELKVGKNEIEVIDAQPNSDINFSILPNLNYDHLVDIDIDSDVIMDSQTHSIPKNGIAALGTLLDTRSVRSRPSSHAPRREYTGLINHGAMCFANSVFQMLYSLEDFRYALYSKELQRGSLHELALTLFSSLQFSLSSLYDASPILIHLGCDLHAQQDANEFMTIFLDGLDMANEIKSIISGEFLSTTVSECGHTNSVSERFLSVPVEVQGFDSLEQSLEHSLGNGKGKGDYFSGDNQYLCSKCNKKSNAMRTTTLKSLPNDLILQLKRFVYDNESVAQQGSKIDTHFSFPLNTISLRSISDGEQEVMFYLHAVVVHAGQANAGHYWTYVRKMKNISNPNAIDDRWVKFNDSHVEYATVNDIIRSFGGMETRLVNNTVISAKRETAYLLTFKRIKTAHSVPLLSPPPEIVNPVIDENFYIVANHFAHEPALHDFVFSLSQLVLEKARSDDETIYRVGCFAIYFFLNIIPDEIENWREIVLQFLSFEHLLNWFYKVLSKTLCEWIRSTLLSSTTISSGVRDAFAEFFVNVLTKVRPSLVFSTQRTEFVIKASSDCLSIPLDRLMLDEEPSVMYEYYDTSEPSPVTQRIEDSPEFLLENIFDSIFSMLMEDQSNYISYIYYIVAKLAEQNPVFSASRQWDLKIISLFSMEVSTVLLASPTNSPSIPFISSPSPLLSPSLQSKPNFDRVCTAEALYFTFNAFVDAIDEKIRLECFQSGDFSVVDKDRAKVLFHPDFYKRFFITNPPEDLIKTFVRYFNTLYTLNLPHISHLPCEQVRSDQIIEILLSLLCLSGISIDTMKPIVGSFLSLCNTEYKVQILSQRLMKIIDNSFSDNEMLTREMITFSIWVISNNPFSRQYFEQLPSRLLPSLFNHAFPKQSILFIWHYLVNNVSFPFIDFLSTNVGNDESTVEFFFLLVEEDDFWSNFDVMFDVNQQKLVSFLKQLIAQLFDEIIRKEQFHPLALTMLMVLIKFTSLIKCYPIDDYITTVKDILNVLLNSFTNKNQYLLEILMLLRLSFPTIPMNSIGDVLSFLTKTDSIDSFSVPLLATFLKVFANELNSDKSFEVFFSSNNFSFLMRRILANNFEVLRTISAFDNFYQTIPPHFTNSLKFTFPLSKAASLHGIQFFLKNELLMLSDKNIANIIHSLKKEMTDFSLSEYFDSYLIILETVIPLIQSDFKKSLKSFALFIRSIVEKDFTQLFEKIHTMVPKSLFPFYYENIIENVPNVPDSLSKTFLILEKAQSSNFSPIVYLHFMKMHEETNLFEEIFLGSNFSSFSFNAILDAIVIFHSKIESLKTALWVNRLVHLTPLNIGAINSLLLLPFSTLESICSVMTEGASLSALQKRFIKMSLLWFVIFKHDGLLTHFPELENVISILLSFLASDPEISQILYVIIEQ